MTDATTRRARILAFVSDAYGGTGGIAQYNRDLIEAISTHAAVGEVVVVPRVISRDIEPLPSRVTHFSSAAGSKIRFVATALRIGASRPRIDLVICGHINLLPVAVAAATLARAPLILVTYGMEVWNPRGGFWRMLVSKAAAIVSISSFTLDKLMAWAGVPAARGFLLPNAVDLTKYSAGEGSEALRRRIGLGAGPVLLTLGRMDADEQAKGFDEILEVLSELGQAFPGLEYCAAGDGSDRPRLQAKAASLGVSDRVRFPGYVSEDEKPDLYRLATVFAMPSRLEGFGYVFLEALASGVPVVASSIDGSREAVRGGALGLLVDPRNRQELIGGLSSALRAPFVPAREELEYFSRARFEERCHRILDSILGNGQVGHDARRP